MIGDVSPAPSVGVVCSMPQYFKKDFFFQALKWLLYVGTKGTPLGSKRGKTYIHNTQNTKASAHYARQLLTASCGIIARQCIIYYSVGFPSGKELALLEVCNQL